MWPIVVIGLTIMRKHLRDISRYNELFCLTEKLYLFLQQNKMLFNEDIKCSCKCLEKF